MFVQVGLFMGNQEWNQIALNAQIGEFPKNGTKHLCHGLQGFSVCSDCCALLKFKKCDPPWDEYAQDSAVEFGLYRKAIK